MRGTSTPQVQCPFGFYCPTGSAVPANCPAGGYQDEPGQGACKSCPGGYYCDPGERCLYSSAVLVDAFTTANFTQPAVCPAGHFCPNGTRYATEFPCPNGTFSNWTQLWAAAGCTPCPPGRWCGLAGQLEPGGLGRARLPSTSVSCISWGITSD